MTSTSLSKTLAISDSGSRVPRPISDPARNIQVPPISLIPTSKLTLVRRDGFSNKRTAVFPDKANGVAPFLIVDAFFTKDSTSPSPTSNIVKKSLLRILYISNLLATPIQAFVILSMMIDVQSKLERSLIITI